MSAAPPLYSLNSLISLNSLLAHSVHRSMHSAPCPLRPANIPSIAPLFFKFLHKNRMLCIKKMHIFWRRLKNIIYICIDKCRFICSATLSTVKQTQLFKFFIINQLFLHYEEIFYHPQVSCSCIYDRRYDIGCIMFYIR